MRHGHDILFTFNLPSILEKYLSILYFGIYFISHFRN